MMRRFLTPFVIAVALFTGAGFVAAPSVSAQVQTGLQEVGETIKLPSTDPRVVAVRIINVALGVIGIIMVSLIVYAGFLYMTSGGEAEKTTKAKKIILNAVIGLIIVLSSWAFTRFVIERLLQATQETGGVSGGGGPGGGFGGGGGAQAFIVKSITPSGSVPIRNVQVKIVFNKAVDPASASAILVSKVGGTTVGGTIDVNGSYVTFTPSADCPAPNQTKKCFDADSDFTVKVGPSVKTTQGQTVTCGGFGSSCDGAFHTGNLVDVAPPSVYMSFPVDGQSVSVNFLQDVQAEATDDSGVGMVEFFDGATSIAVDAPNATTTPMQYSAKGQWNTTGAPLGAHTLTADASDIDTNTAKSAPITVMVRPEHCFNGVQDDPVETGIDCGGDPNSQDYCGACAGGSCTKNADCASGFCLNGQCVEKPVIQTVTPLNGKPGTFVTLKGLNFGSLQGTVTFLGLAGTGDDKIASAPLVCTNAGINTWTNTEVTVAVPDGAASGPIEIKHAVSGLTDATNDTVGPPLPPFLVDNTTHPGICAVQPNVGSVGSEADIVGEGFGGAAEKVLFGTTELSAPFPMWSETKVRFQVPVVNSAPYAVSVKTADGPSNAVTYTVVDKSYGALPVLQSLDPVEGPQQTYMTLFGQNFGWSVGTVIFSNQSGQAIGDTSFPAACSAGFWRDDTIIVKIPTKLTNGLGVPDGTFKVKVKRPDLKESNELEFAVNSQLPLKPGICAIQPAVGPVGTAVTISGESFGAQAPIVTFALNKLALVSSNSTQEVKTNVPAGAVTGKVFLKANGQESNKVNFQVRNCNEAPGICSPQTEQCCPTGECKLINETCGVAALSAEYAWRTSTGLIPVAPRVIEECRPDLTPSPTPSPSPWLGREGGDQAPVDAVVMMRFTHLLEPSTVTMQAFRLLKCTSASNEPCTTTANVPFTMTVLSENNSQQVVKLTPSPGPFATNTTYLVTVTATIKAKGTGGATMEPVPGCGTGPNGESFGYCFRFKTRASSEPSKVGAVNVIPSPYTMKSSGETAPYSSVPLNADDKCIVLDCKLFNWDWYTGSAPNNQDGRATITNIKVNNKGLCEQTGTGLIETGVVPVNMNAELIQSTPIVGTGKLFVNFVPPKVEDYAPKCDTACVNALIWARFTEELQENTVNALGNVEVRKCFNENCVESELSPPLDPAKVKVNLVPPFGSSGDVPRVITIDTVYVDQNGTNFLLEPGAFYRVLLKGGPNVPNGITGKNGVPITGLNHPLGFQWTFRVKIGTDAVCKADRVDVVPLQKYETVVGARQLFMATPFGSPDQCSASGQALIQSSSAGWTSSDTLVADLYKINNALVDTGPDLPQGCSGSCLATGAPAQYGKVAVCGNGKIETTDAQYCKAGQTPKGDPCTLMPAGAKAGEECEPSIDGAACNIQTCLWQPVQLATLGGTCGNAVVDAGAGEACDFGPTCVGGSASTSTPPVPELTPCATPAAKTACEQAGGTCSMHAYRGCSANCRHLGSLAGGTTCGNGDYLGDGKDCDDGNTTEGDGCSAMCLHEGSSATDKIPAVCGNAILEPGETCERADVMSPFPSGCDAVKCLHTGKLACASPADVQCCGNGKIESGEDCDDLNIEGRDGCSPSCLFEGSSSEYSKLGVMSPSFCGNGRMEQGEQCEDGVSSNVAAQIINYGSPNPNTNNVLGLGSGLGDGLIDRIQLAFITGNKLPDPQTGLMSSDITATLEGQSGKAIYGLQCGFTDESSCPVGTGLDAGGCCAPRPAVQTKYPPQGATGVCRNVQISAIWNVPMDSGSVVNNIEIAFDALPNVTCPTGTTEILVQKTYGPGMWNWVVKTWDRIVAWATGWPTYAQKWCKGSVTGQLAPVSGTTSTKFVFTLDSALAANTKYRVRFLGDNSDPNDPLADNADPAKRLGVKSARGVVHPFETGNTGDLVWTFTTGNDVCAANVITIDDVTPDPAPPDQPHPFLFINKNNQPETRNFEAVAQSIQNGVAVPLSPVNEYAWKWAPWTSSDQTIVTVQSLQPNNVGTSDTANGQSKQKNGNAILTASLEITKDIVNVPSTTGNGLQGVAQVSVLVCENPWPSLTTSPFRDILNSPNFKPGDPFYGLTSSGYFNFSTMYCRDAGNPADTSDDIPALKINQVQKTALDDLNGILRQYLFTYPPETPATPPEYRGLAKDGIGIRIVSNPQHLSPVEWYFARGFTGSPKTISVDGYPAIQDGTTIYVAASNRPVANSGKIYSNIYLISHNPDAKETTKKIYDDMVRYLSFNINIVNQSNVCVKLNGIVYTNPQVNNGQPIQCSADWECFGFGVQNLHCDSMKLKLARDTQRLTDFQAMTKAFEERKDPLGRYPRADAGTFLRGLSTSLWTSWQDEIGQSIAYPMPKDPVNRFLTCGRCETTLQPCETDDDCPKTDQPNACKGGSYQASVWAPNDDIDPKTCWNSKQRKFLCPRVGLTAYGSSRLYQYRSLVGGAQYELGAEYEIPPLNLNDWWYPPLPAAVYKCVTTSTYGQACAGANGLADDKLCRSCPNPASCKTCTGGTKSNEFCSTTFDCPDANPNVFHPCTENLTKFPIVSGACRQVGGSYKYKDICVGQVLGETGVCGDGVLNANEVCELGETKYASCTVPPNTPGFKQQICNPANCAGFIDDVQHPQCIAGVFCGNGKVDYGCGGDPTKPCLTDGNCLPNIQCTAVEKCDDGSLNGTYGHCSTNCQGPAGYCGDDQLSPGEVCDEGSSNGAYNGTCNLSCSGIGPFCGDLEVNGPEECDGGSEATKSKICSAPASVAGKKPCETNQDCGAGGVCGGTTATQSCEGVQVTVNNIAYDTQHTKTCKKTGGNKCKWNTWTGCQAIGSCGDGFKDLNEECDDGELNGDTHACTAVCKKNVCGDNKVNVGVEECDNGLQNGQVTCTADYDSMCLSCSTQCKHQATAGGYCGDSVKNGPEQCDGSVPQGVTCTSLGYDYGTVQCTPSCTFGSCTRCSDVPGTGVLKGRVYDAVFSRVVPGARVTVLYKGTKVDEAFTDNDGYFEIKTLNTNSSCNSYRLVVDFYQDNPCTASEHEGYSCYEGFTPPYIYPQDIDESLQGGYFPLTSDLFSYSTIGTVFDFTEGSDEANIYIFPRPEIGKAYAAILWRATGNNSSNKAFHMNTILPNGAAFTVVNHDEGESASGCDYATRPSANGTCARDVSWRAIGGWDLSKLPYTRSICLHRYGEKTSGWINQAANGCPYEGTAACLANHPDNQQNPKTVASCANSTDQICVDCGADVNHDCSEDAIWQSCAVVRYGPVVALTNYAAMAGMSGNIDFTFVGTHKSASGFASHIRTSSYKYTAYVAIGYTGIDGGTELFTVTPPASGNGYVWHIGSLSPTTGSFSKVNQFKGTDSDDNDMASSGSDSEKPMDGLACFRYWFQCGGNNYCIKDGDNTKINSTVGVCYQQGDQDSCEAQATWSCGNADSSLYHKLNW